MLPLQQILCTKCWATYAYSSSVGIVHASSAAGLGRADSAAASLEALLVELSSASTTAAAALAPFTSSSAAVPEAVVAPPRVTLSNPPSAQFVQSPDVAQRGTAQHELAQHELAQHELAQHDAAQQDGDLLTSSALSVSQLPASSALPPKPLIADLTDSNVRQLEAMSSSVGPSSTEQLPQSLLPLLLNAPSAASLSPRSSTPLEDPPAGAQLVARLQGELQQHQEAFNDDLAFIQEVQSHQILAAGMNPNLELQSLHKRFHNWKFDFKVGPHSM